MIEEWFKVVEKHPGLIGSLIPLPDAGLDAVGSLNSIKSKVNRKFL